MSQPTSTVRYGRPSSPRHRPDTLHEWRPHHRRVPSPAVGKSWGKGRRGRGDPPPLLLGRGGGGGRRHRHGRPPHTTTTTTRRSTTTVIPIRVGIPTTTPTASRPPVGSQLVRRCKHSVCRTRPRRPPRRGRGWRSGGEEVGRAGGRMIHLRHPPVESTRRPAVARSLPTSWHSGGVGASSSSSSW